MYAVCQSRLWDSRYVHGEGLALVEKDRQRHCTSSSLASLVSLAGAARTLVGVVVIVVVKARSSERNDALEENMMTAMDT